MKGRRVQMPKFSFVFEGRAFCCLVRIRETIESEDSGIGWKIPAGFN